MGGGVTMFEPQGRAGRFQNSTSIGGNRRVTNLEIETR